LNTSPAINHTGTDMALKLQKLEPQPMIMLNGSFDGSVHR
jgi:hypothetical protein